MFNINIVHLANEMERERKRERERERESVCVCVCVMDVDRQQGNKLKLHVELYFRLQRERLCTFQLHAIFYIR